MIKEEETNAMLEATTVWDQLAVLVLGTAAGFLAGKATESTYKRLIIARRIK